MKVSSITLLAGAAHFKSALHPRSFYRHFTRPKIVRLAITAFVFLLQVSFLSACRAKPHTPTVTLIPRSTRTATPALDLTATFIPTTTLTPTLTLTPVPLISFPKIDRQPPAVQPEWWNRGVPLEQLPSYDPADLNNWQVDLRAYDLSGLDLFYEAQTLFYATFDDRTIWPARDRMPPNYNYQKIMDLGKNPGLGVRSLHARGITGEGIGIALIDMPLLVDHQEYRDRLRLYEELFFGEEADQQPADMHGLAVASIAVGQTTGVAPQADLYYIAVDLASGQDADGKYLYDFTRAAQAIRRVLEINQQLPAERKIRVISMSFGWASGFTGYEAISAAVAEARAQGLFIVSAYPAMDQIYGFKFSGLERSPLADPDSFTFYTRLYICNLYASSLPMCQAGRLLVPMNSRTTASPMGQEEYVFYRLGDESGTIPYLAGMYALAAQVDAEITPERFWELALQTGRQMDITGTSGTYTLGPVLDPVELVEALGK